MDLDLVDLGLDLGNLVEILKAFDTPVRDADCTGFAVFVDLLHCSPCFFGVLCQVFEDDVLFILLVIVYIFWVN